MERRAVRSIKRAEEIGHKPVPFAARHLRGRDHGREVAASDDLRNALARALADRHVRVLAAEHRDGIARAVAGGVRPQPPVHICRVHNADPIATAEPALDQAAGRKALAAPGPADNRRVLVEDFDRKLSHQPPPH